MESNLEPELLPGFGEGKAISEGTFYQIDELTNISDILLKTLRIAFWRLKLYDVGSTAANPLEFGKAKSKAWDEVPNSKRDVEY